MINISALAHYLIIDEIQLTFMFRKQDLWIEPLRGTVGNNEQENAVPNKRWRHYRMTTNGYDEAG